MGDQRLPEKQPGWVPRYKDQIPAKCVLKHKKAQLKYPPFLEGHRCLFSKEEMDELRRDCLPYEGLPSVGIQGNIFPRISQGVYSVATNKSQRKLPGNAGLFSSISSTQQRGRECQYKVQPCSQVEGDSDLFANCMQVPMHEKNLNNKWLHWENQKEGSQKHSKHGNLSYNKHNHGGPKNPRSFQGNCLSLNTPINQDLLDAVYYRYLKRGVDGLCEWNEPLGDLAIMGTFDMGYSCQGSAESSFKNIGYLPSNLNPFKTLDFVNDIGLSKRKTPIDMKLAKSCNTLKTTLKKNTYGPAHQKPKHSKTIGNQEPVASPKTMLEIQGKSFCKPNILEDLNESINFKDFIVHKSYNMPSMINKLIMTRGSDYDSAKTLVPGLLNNYKMKKQGKYQDGENGGKELD